MLDEFPSSSSSTELAPLLSETTHTALASTQKTLPTPCTGSPVVCLPPLRPPAQLGPFRLIEELGRGGMGVVYRGFDQSFGGEVALKTLQRFDAAALRRFKREFRALADISHPNLVTLFGLHEIDGAWLVSMEWVRGKPLRHGATQSPAELRKALRQLADGLVALHRGGWIHRDLKPSNVLITPGGRVVILDFGLAAALDADHVVRQTGTEVLGTLAYMAPEQLSGAPLTPAVDWYAFGVLLFELLTGQVPFTGVPSALLAQKLTGEARPPSSLADGISPRLDELCLRLLARDPSRRPGVEEIFAELGGPGRAQKRSRQVKGFFGRRDERRALAREAARSARGGLRLITVEGPSGIGKSALVERFLADAARSEDAPVVFAGRCYEQESLPFKALDPLLDEMSQWLLRAPDEERRRLLPAGGQRLATLFPVFRQFYPQAPDDARLTEDGGRIAAARALRELLRAVARTRPVVLWIDDLQWADRESADLLARALDVKANILFIGSQRPQVPGVDGFTALIAAGLGGLELAPLPLRLRPLRHVESMEVARGLLPGSEAVVELLARECKGSPYLLAEMARYLRADPGALPESGAVLDEILRRRMHDLPAACLRLLETIAVAGRPLPLAVAYAASGVGHRGPQLLGRLRTRCFVQIVERGGDKQVDTYHDRIRETLGSHLDRDHTRMLHGRIAEAFEDRALGGSAAALGAGAGDAPAARPPSFDIAHHFARAGRFEKALGHAISAAEQALAAGSLAAAERFYRIAEQGLDGRSARRLQVLEGLGSVLILRGRYDDAEIRLRAAIDQAGTAITEARLAGRLGELAFRRGRLGEAESILERALRRLGAPTPRSTIHLLPRLAWELLRQWAHSRFPQRWLDRRPLAESEEILVAARLYSRLAYTSWFARRQLHCAWAHLRGLNLSEGCEPSSQRIQAYVEHAPITTLFGAPGRGLRYADRAEDLARQTRDGLGLALARNYRGILFHAEARFEDCLRECRAAATGFERSGDAWELNVARIHVAFSLYRLGYLEQAEEEARQVLERGRRIGDIQAVALAIDVWAKASGGELPVELIDEQLASPREDAQSLSHLYQARGLVWLAASKRGDHGAADRAVAAFEKAAAAGRGARMINAYVAPSFAWLATSLRRRAEQEQGQAARRSLRRARRVARRALEISRRYPGDRAHVLREIGRIKRRLGRPDAALWLERSLDAARRRSAVHEEALTVELLHCFSNN